MQSPDIMKKVPHITIMGGAHFYTNAHTVCAEYNIMADPEAADVVFRFGTPITMVTLEACQDGTAPLNADDISKFKSNGTIGAFCMQCNQVTIDLAKKAYGYEQLELPDPVAYAVFSKPELITNQLQCADYH